MSEIVPEFEEEWKEASIRFKLAKTNARSWVFRYLELILPDDSISC